MEPHCGKKKKSFLFYDYWKGKKKAIILNRKGRRPTLEGGEISSFKFEKRESKGFVENPH